MLFPAQWTRVHPEHERFDVGFDIPDCYLPEFPPPLYLTTHPELGDVSRGVEITYANYFEMFNGILTPEQLDGLRLLVTPFQTTWFNVTHHRVTAEPSQGVACFSCHVNGHTNGAIELAPDSRPNYARLRVDTPTMRGNYAQLLFSSKRSIRTMDHFAEVEEYFDGDTAMLAAIGGRDLQKAQTNHMGDFNAIIDFPPAPKLDVDEPSRSPAKATPQELRGEALFTGKAQCAGCHPAGDALHRQHDARPQGRALLRRPPRGADQDLPAARHQGFAALPARRPTAHARGRGRVLRRHPRHEADVQTRRRTSWRICGRCDPTSTGGRRSVAAGRCAVAAGAAPSMTCPPPSTTSDGPH